MEAVFKAPSSAMTRLRKLSSDLDLEETNLYYFFNNSPDLLAIIAPDGSFIRTNNSWNKILGWNSCELDDEVLFSLLHGDDVEKMYEVMDFLTTSDLNRFHCRVRCRNGRYVVVEFSATKWVNGRSNLVGRIVPDLCLTCPETSHRLNWRSDAYSKSE